MKRNLKVSLLCALATCFVTGLGTPAMATELETAQPVAQISMNVSDAPIMVADLKADKKERRRLRRWREQTKAKLKTETNPEKKKKLHKLASDIHKKIKAMNAKIKDGGSGG